MLTEFKKKIGLVMLISDKVYFRARKLLGGKRVSHNDIVGKSS